MPNNVIVPEIGTKCIYPVLDAEKIKNFCIQKDGVIITDNNHKVSQTQDNTHFLEHSTDTTAMRSFDNATIIGVVLALCATWFAWWCAKKSFKVTEYSFNLMLKELEESSKNTQESNLMLFKNQLALKEMDFRSKKNENIRNKLLDLSKTYLTASKDFLRNLYDYLNYINDNLEHEISYKTEILNNLNVDLSIMLNAYFEYTFLVNDNNDLVGKINADIEFINGLAYELKYWVLSSTTTKSFMDESGALEDFNNHIIQVRVNLKELISDSKYYK